MAPEWTESEEEEEVKILVSCFHRGCVCSSSEKGGEGSGGGITGNKRVSFLYFPSPSIAVSIGGEETKVYIRLYAQRIAAGGSRD